MAAPKKKQTRQKKSVKRNTKTDKKTYPITCPTVGMGASAGGLAAFKTFFSHMPDDSGMAFVLVPHLDPSHKSLMVELLANHTKMPVHEAKADMRVEPNHVYIIPPAKYLAIIKGALVLSEPPQQHKLDTAIDFFLHSLAVDQAERSIGIILSGTSSHGTSGLQFIKASGGMAMVQQPESAEYAAMPQNAINSGTVDFILPPEDMPAALIKYVQHAYVSGTWQPSEPAKTELEQLERVLNVLRARTKYDFRYYRKNMILRRIQRRMGLSHMDNLADYYQLLRENSDEASHLLRDLLISVTGFFREPEAYRILQEHVIPLWLEQIDSDTPIRIWVPGCATGEEAYSMAMLLIEQYSAVHKPLNLQIFATDIDETALTTARQGAYPVSIAADLSPERLSRFFIQTGSHYQITKQVRDLVVFAAQNMISDAPFSKLDMISCRNLLIYLEPEVQRKVISLFHFALNENGFLLLGSSETIGRHLDLFETISKKWRVFRRIGSTRRNMVDFPITANYKRLDTVQPGVEKSINSEINFAALTQRQLLDDYAPASALINRKLVVLYFQGPTGDFLEAPTGEPTRDLIAMARQGLQTKLRAACLKAIHEERTVSDSSARVKRKGKWYPCSITIKPVIDPNHEGLLLVTFQSREANETTDTIAGEDTPIEESALVRQLEYELKSTRDDLQSNIEDSESATEELKSSNEEIMSMNEELQSANEELETSKEELQSLNEELSTVNNQLQEKVEELDSAYSDVTNLLNSADNATLFLDTNLCIRLFTPTTGKLLGLIPTDTDRPISTFATDFTGADLQEDARKVLDTLVTQEKVLSTSNGRHYLRRILPYRTSDNHIDGLVITFIDITQRIEAEQQSHYLTTVLRDSNDAISVLGLDGKITVWNRGAERLYGYTEAEALTMNISDIVPANKQAETQDYIKRIALGEDIKSFDTSRLKKDGGILSIWATVTPLKEKSGETIAIATTERDLSERQQLDALRVQTEQLQNIVENLPIGAVYRENDQLTMNRAAEEITGYHRDEITTLDIWFKKLFRERATEVEQQYLHDRESGFLKRSIPIAHYRKNDELCYIEYAGYRFDEHEVWILYDVTQREEYETALREREERLLAIMNNAAEAIVVISLDGQITDFNIAAQALFGYTADEAIGHNVNLLMPSPYRESHDQYLAHYKKTGEPRVLNQLREMPGQHKDGTIFPLELTITQIDHLGAFVGIIRDLSEQRALERQIAEISTQEQERIGQEIHDGLGQQLTGLSMMASSIKHTLTEQNLPQAKQMEELTLNLQQAIMDARNLSHGLAPVPVTPEGLTDAFIMLAREVKSNTGIDCSFKAHATVDIKDRTNAMQLYRITQEAVNNAIKHAHAKNIHIILDGSADQCELSISDDGCGFQLEDTQDGGIGIRIMRYRASIIGCNLNIESTPKKGTTVRCQHSGY